MNGGSFMYKLISNLILYGHMDQDEILVRLAKLLDDKEKNDDELRQAIYVEIKRLLELATQYGFNDHLWHNYLTYILITNENPFSMTCEKQGAKEGSVNHFALNDFQVFYDLFHYDFSAIEKRLNIDCFTTLAHYQALSKPELMYNKNVSLKVQELSKCLEKTQNNHEFFDVVTQFYKDYGVGMFGLNKAFRIATSGENFVELKPINNMDEVVLNDLIGYEIQKKKLLDNTIAFVEGRKANNVLLYGDSGTGKSTSIKAIVNEFYDRGLRMIEIYKHQFKDLSNIIAMIKNRNYRFIIYMDDLSFEEFETEYKFLKAVIEGGVETRPENILIYATSNRRHIIKETWADREDVVQQKGIHQSDTMEEKLSLVNRFGITINFSKPMKKEFNHIVLELAHKNHIQLTDDELLAEANKWELNHGGTSGRTAQQFINYLLGLER